MLLVQQIVMKSIVKKNKKFGLFNGSSHVVVAHTTAEIGVLRKKKKKV